MLNEFSIIVGNYHVEYLIIYIPTQHTHYTRADADNLNNSIIYFTHCEHMVIKSLSIVFWFNPRM